MDALRLLDGRLKLRHLVLVDVLTTHGSVIAAAGALHITQPVATRTLRELESILGVPLYERGPRGVAPTIFGETFTRHARAILAQLTQAGRHVTELADAHRGTVVVGTDPGGVGLLLRAVARLKSERPELTVIIREGAAEALAVELGAGRVDLTVGRRVPNADDAEVQAVLCSEPVGVFTRAAHPLALRPAVTFADLQSHPWIIPGAETGLRREAELLFARHSLPLPENRVEVTSLHAVRQLLLEGDLIALLPAPIGHADPGLRALPLPLNSVKSPIAMTTAAGRMASPGAQTLMQMLRDLAAEAPESEAPQLPVPSRAS